jgi:hypothetical protein
MTSDCSTEQCPIVRRHVSTGSKKRRALNKIASKVLNYKSRELGRTLRQGCVSSRQLLESWICAVCLGYVCRFLFSVLGAWTLRMSPWKLHWILYTALWSYFIPLHLLDLITRFNCTDYRLIMLIFYFYILVVYSLNSIYGEHFFITFFSRYTIFVATLFLGRLHHPRVRHLFLIA